MTADSPERRERRNELLRTMFKLVGTEFSRCFAPPSLCPEEAIRAHSVQNARCLELLAHNGHVVAPVLRLDARTGPSIDLTRVGRNRATTFTGLCREHDRNIFAPIETAAVDLDSPEHRFLLAYRATFYEIHATCAAAWQVQTSYLTRVELGFDPKDQPSDAGLFATDRMMVACETFRYKEAFDEAFLVREYSSLAHDVLLFDVAQPTLAACALFSLDHAPRADDLVRVCLNILPLDSTRTAAVFSYMQTDAPRARAGLDRILSSSGHHQRYELSRRLLNSCQNFVLSPVYVATWSDEKRQAIVRYFVRTALQDDFSVEDPNLFLF
jgi:hypothetical protein